MTFVVTDGNTLFVDRCLTSLYVNPVANEEFEKTHDHCKIIQPNDWWIKDKNNKVVVGAFIGEHKAYSRVKQVADIYGDLLLAFNCSHIFNPEESPNFLGVLSDGRICKIGTTQHYIFPNGQFVIAGSGAVPVGDIHRFVPDLTPAEAMILSYRLCNGVSINYDYWENGEIKYDCEFTVEEEDAIMDKIQKRFDLKRFNLKS